jgi:site-specific recombinase XerD
MGRNPLINVPGPLAPHVASFRRYLIEQGYASYSVIEKIRLVAHVSCWLEERELECADVTQEQLEEFLRARQGEGYARPVSSRGMVTLLDHLRDLGVVPPARPAGLATPVEVLVAQYRKHLVEERRLSPASIGRYLDVAATFLSQQAITDEASLADLTTADVTAFVLSVSRRYKGAYAKAVATRLRSLLRFLHVEGLTPKGLSSAVPSVAGWRLTALPEGIGGPDVVRLLKSCDRRTAVGRRDFAIITVLARLGLRAAEAAALRLEDIDWRKGEVKVRGKGNREDRLPLPHDVGEAVAGWLQRGRPRCSCPAVFTRVLAPHRGLSDRGVSTVVRQACGRAGLPPVGSHRLRHYAATQILRAGGDLTEVGQVLRHFSTAATAIYAKVDRRALVAVVQPWPGALS